MSARTLIDLFHQRVSESGDSTALRYRSESGWTDVSFADWLRTSSLLAAGLIDLGLRVGDRVAIMSRTRAEWVYADQAGLLAGGVIVPVTETSRPRQARIVLEDSGSKLAFVEDPAQLEKLLRVWPELPELSHIIYFDELAELDESTSKSKYLRFEDLDLGGFASRIIPISRLRELGARALGSNSDLVGTRRGAISEESLASIVYTAGTTGRPRGVALTHGAFVSQVEGNRLALPLSEKDEQVLFLPLTQMLARAIYITAMAAGCINSFSRGYAWLFQDIEEIQPTLIVAVPRVFEKVLERTRRRVVAGSDSKRKLFDRAVGTARRKANSAEGRDRFTPLDRLAWAIGDALVFRGVRGVFGKRFKYAVSGGAPLQVETAEFFAGAGIRILEGYGLTEHCGAATVNQLEDCRLGTVGKPLPGVDIRIASDGEILLRSQCVMVEYWNDAAASAAALAGAWLHTGDVGEFDGNYLRITDRKKDVIITAGGRSVAPSALETALQGRTFIQHAVVHGDRRSYLTALITLDEARVMDWAKENGLGAISFSELTQHPEVFAKVEAAVAEVNAEQPRSSAIRRFAILQGDFTMHSGELTATWKTRRKFVTEKYRSILDGLYE
ncbi:MAG: long-chain acyl-CoA synthetase [Bradymonadia bacterium]|jgi:long-chain acyl-CoA synthetase